MADDVVFLVPGMRPFGKKEFAAAQGSLAGYKLEADSQVREIKVTGDWAYCWTDLAVAMTPTAGGPTIRRSGNTLSILQRKPDGRWVLTRDANMLALENADAQKSSSK